MENTEKHLSNSSFRIEIEKEVVAILSERENIDFKSGQIPIGIEKIKFNFDFHYFSDDLNIIGEVYSRTDNVKGSVEGKIAKDCLKLLSAEKLLKIKCTKKLVFIDENVKKEFEKKTKWLARTIKEFGIELDFVKIDKVKMKAIQEDKENQREGNRFKK